MIPGVDYVGVGVGALIVRNNRALMLLRTDRCRNNQGKWTIPGGMVEAAETLENAIRREAFEETGMALESVDFLVVSDRFFDRQHWVSILYLCTADGEPDLREPELHSNLQWLDIDHLPENVTLPSLDAVNAYKKR